jgi:hypothetical protein
VDTVETFVRACIRYAQARQIPLSPDVADVDRWLADYRAMESALADQAADREQIAGRPVPNRRRRLALPAQLPADVSAFTGRTGQLADLDALASNDATGTVIAAIAGTAGVGKTALAVHCHPPPARPLPAHRVRRRPAAAPDPNPLTLTAPAPGVIPEHFTDRQQALDWFTTEHTVLLAAVDYAATTGLDTYTWQLARTLRTFLDLRGHWDDLARPVGSR